MTRLPRATHFGYDTALLLTDCLLHGTLRYMITEYRKTLNVANKIGSAHATDEGLMAQYCATSLQFVVGAASPELVWNGAQKRGLSTRELAALAIDDPSAVHDLMWM